jgi:hypothetical protein
LAAWLKWYSTCLSKCKALSSNPRTKNKTFSKIGKKISGEKKLKYCAYKICCPFPNSILHIISGEKSHSGIYTHTNTIYMDFILTIQITANKSLPLTSLRFQTFLIKKTSY